MNNLFFYLPLLYRYHTRERRRFLIPFMLTDFLPVFILACSVENIINLHFIATFLFAFFAMFSIYEIGYIINDSITIKNELSPVLRLKQAELKYFEKKELFIFGIRFSNFILFCVLLWIQSKENLTIYLFCNIALLITYFFHNYFRNKIRFITNTFLNVGKYFIPLIGIAFSSSFYSILVYFIYFTFFRSITYILEKETKININSFQIVFVLICLFGLSIAAYVYKLQLSICEYLFYAAFSMYKFVVCLLQLKGNPK